VCYALSASIEKYPLNLLEIFLQNRLEMAEVKNNTLPEKWGKTNLFENFRENQKKWSLEKYHFQSQIA
jgi:hypothetical protein